MIDFGLIIKGLGTGYTLTPAVGLQNAFILNTALKKQNHIIAAWVCTFASFILITLGVTGIGTFLARNEITRLLLTIVGVVFLTYFAIKSFMNYYDKKDFIELDEKQYKEKNNNIVKTIVAGLGVSLLNPQNIINTVLVTGTITAPYGLVDSITFGIGTLVAAGTWFLTLAIRGSALSKFLRKKSVWKTIDVLTGLLCLWIAYGMIKELYDLYISSYQFDIQFLSTLA
jgi:L-lysine exporter family protein LysE/ArgO